MEKFSLNKARLLFALTALSLPLYTTTSLNAQELPPEPDIQDIFGDLEPPTSEDLDINIDESAVEPPPLPDMGNELNPAIEDNNNQTDSELLPPPIQVDELDGMLENAPLEQFPEDASMPPIDAEDMNNTDNESFPPLPEEEQSLSSEDTIMPIEETITNSDFISTLPEPTAETEEEYKQLKQALFEFLGKDANNISNNTTPPETLPDDTLNDFPNEDASDSAISDLAIDSPEENTSAAPAPTETLGTADDFLDTVVNEPSTTITEIEEETPAPSNKTAEVSPRDTAASPTAEKPVASEPTPAIEPKEDKVKETTEKKPAFVQPEEPKAEPLPALSAEEKDFIDQVDQASDALPDFSQLPQKEKDALQKPLEALAREQKEKDLANATPQEQQSLVRGGDLSAIKKDDMGTATSETYELSVSEKSKTDNFLSTDIQLEMAYRALLSGQLEAAIDIYKTVMEKHPENQTAMFGLASAYQKNFQYEQAKELYQELLDVSPNHKEALNNYLVLMTQEAPEDALLELQKLERVSPYYSPIPAQIGMVYYRMGEYIQAERYLRKAISMAPDNVNYLYNLAIISDHLGKAEQSIALYERLLEESKKGKSIPGSTQQISERLNYLRKKSY